MIDYGQWARRIANALPRQGALGSLQMPGDYQSWAGQQPYPSGKLDPYGPFVNPYSPSSQYRNQQLQAHYAQQPSMGSQANALSTPQVSAFPGRTLPSAAPGQWSSQGQAPAPPGQWSSQGQAPAPGGALGSLAMPTPWNQMQPGVAPTQDVIGDEWFRSPLEMGAAFYRHAAAVAAERQANGMANQNPQYWLNMASRATENPLPTTNGTPGLNAWGHPIAPLTTDAYGNQRFDYNPQMGGQFGYGTGQYNPGDRTRTGLSTTPIAPVFRPASPMTAPSMRPTGSAVTPPSRIGGPPRTSR